MTSQQQISHKILKIQVSLMKGRTQISEMQVSPMKGGLLDTSPHSKKREIPSLCFS